jgi:hypothetical protein
MTALHVIRAIKDIQSPIGMIAKGTVGKMLRTGAHGSFVRIRWQDGRICLVSIWDIEDVNPEKKQQG